MSLSRVPLLLGGTHTQSTDDLSRSAAQVFRCRRRLRTSHAWTFDPSTGRPPRSSWRSCFSIAAHRRDSISERRHPPQERPLARGQGHLDPERTCTPAWRSDTGRSLKVHPDTVVVRPVPPGPFPRRARRAACPPRRRPDPRVAAGLEAAARRQESREICDYQDDPRTNSFSGDAAAYVVLRPGSPLGRDSRGALGVPRRRWSRSWSPMSRQG